jgi:hypothetical protein
MEVDEEELNQVVRSAFGRPATLVRVERITDTFAGEIAWDGIVHVFSLDGHSEAAAAYA